MSQLERQLPPSISPVISLLFVLALLASAVAGRLVTTAVEDRLVEVRTAALHEVEERFGQEVSWRTVSPSILRGFTFSGVQISRGLVSVQSVSLRVDVPALLSGAEGSPVQEISLRNPVAEIRSAEDFAGIMETVAQFSGGSPGEIPKITISVSNGRIIWAIPEEDHRVDIAGLSGRMSMGQSTSLEVYAALHYWGVVGDDPFDAAAEILVSGEGISRLDTAGFTVSLSRIAGSHFALQDQVFRINRDGDTVAVQRIRSQDPLDISVQLDAATREATVNLQSESYRLSSLVDLRGPWASLAPWLREPVTTRTTMRFSADQGFVHGTGRVSVPVTQDIVPAPFHLAAAFSATREEVLLSSFEVRPLGGTGVARGQGSWRSGDVAPSGNVTFQNFRYHELPHLEGSLSARSTNETMHIAAQYIAVDALPIRDLSGSLRFDGGYTSARVSGSLEDNGSRVSAVVRFSSLDDMNGEISLEDFSVSRGVQAASIASIAVDLPPAAAGVRASGSFRFDYRDGSLTVRVPFMTVTDDENPHRRASFSGTYRDGAVALRHLLVQEGETMVHVAGDGMVYRDDTIDFSLVVRFRGVPYHLEGTFDPHEATIAVVIDGALELTIERMREGFRMAGHARNLEIPVNRVGRLTSEIDGLFLNSREWFLTFHAASLRNVELLPGLPADISFTAAVEPQQVRFAITDYTDRHSTLAGSGELLYDTGEQREDYRLNIQLRALNSEEQYRLAARHVDGFTAADLRFGAAPVARVLPGATRGTAEGTIQFVGSPEEPELRAFVTTERLIIREESAAFRGFLFADQGTLELRDSLIASGINRVEVESISLDRVSGEVSGDLTFERLEMIDPIGLQIQGTAAPFPALEIDELRAMPLDLNIVFREGDPEPNGAAAVVSEDPRRRQFRLRRDPSAVSIAREDGAISLRLAENGTLSGQFGGDLPVTATLSGFLEPGWIEATLSGIEVDLPRLPVPPGLADFSLESGTAAGSLRIIGRPDDPDIFGTLLVNDGQIRTPFSPDAAGPLEPALIFEEKLLRITPVETRIGTATARASAELLLNQLAMEQFRLELAVLGDTGVHVRSNFGPLEVDGFARGSLTVDATPQVISVSGTIVAYGTELSVDQDFEADQELENNFVVDLTVRTGRAVRFLWPDSDFPVLRSNMATGQQVTIRADTREDSFSLTGNVDIQSGDIFYFDRSFLIRSGEIDFRETQDEFDPRLTARAEIREITPDGPVRIYLVADGQRLSEFSPRFESNPPLLGPDIVAILGGNILQTGTGGPVNIQTALVSTSDIVTQFGFFRRFENNVRSALDLDLFAVRTSFIQNILLSAINPLDENAPPVAPSLGTYLNNTSIFMGRYLGDSVFGQLVFQMRARDDFAMAGNQRQNDGIQSLGGVLIDAEISLEWQTPFFLLEWNFAPQNPEELFIRDNTFSFLWSFSY